MNRKITREIFIEIETIRVTRKRAARKNATAPPKSDVSNHADSFVKTDARLKYLFDKLF
jgi:hypothetical protein